MLKTIEPERTAVNTIILFELQLALIVTGHPIAPSLHASLVGRLCRKGNPERALVTAHHALAVKAAANSFFKRVGYVTLNAVGLADRVRDLVFLLDEFPKFNQSDALLAGGFDLGKVAVAGWSWGGPTAGEFCRIDSRCRAAISLDLGREEDAPECLVNFKRK
jgi:hypothetical protein